MTTRHWRTRVDPFYEINDEIQEKLQEDPFLCGKKVFTEFQNSYPGKYDDKLLRTFQRRCESWRNYGQLLKQRSEPILRGAGNDRSILRLRKNVKMPLCKRLFTRDLPV